LSAPGRFGVLTWITHPNDGHPLHGRAPIDYMTPTGVIAIFEVRTMLDALAIGH
jgi:Protein of unknown function (DUF2384)